MTTANTVIASPFKVGVLKTLPAGMDSEETGRRGRTQYNWPIHLRRKGSYMEVPYDKYQSALASAKDWAERENKDVEDKNKRIVIKSMAGMDEDGNVPRIPLVDKKGNATLLKNGEAKTVPANYWIVRTR